VPVVNYEELTAAALARVLPLHDSNSHAVVQRGLSPPTPGIELQLVVKGRENSIDPWLAHFRYQQSVS